METPPTDALKKKYVLGVLVPKIADIVKTPLDSKERNDLLSVEDEITPLVSPIKINKQSSTKSVKNPESMCAIKFILSPSTPPTLNRGDRSSTPSNVSLNEGEESSFTDVTSEAASSRDVSSLSHSKLKTEVCDATTRHEMNTSENTTQTDGFFETSFMNRFDLTALLKNMKILVSGQ